MLFVLTAGPLCDNCATRTAVRENTWSHYL